MPGTLLVEIHFLITLISIAVAFSLALMSLTALEDIFACYLIKTKTKSKLLYHR
ncbi:hypothetical protein Hanom_Chr12g01148601 [Helianthus anomalus]